MQTLSSVPAKLILSGEHAVVYNSSALSMALELYTQCKCDFQSSQTHSLTIELTNFQQKYSFPFAVWQNLASHIEARYTSFSDGNLSIQGVLVQPVDLILDTLYHFNNFHTIKHGEWFFTIDSDIPIGKGLGSSAAIIIALLTTLFKHHGLALDKDTLLALARKVESRQHGRSSGIDPATILYGGLLEFHAKNTTKKLKEHAFKAWLVDTGMPDSSTGQAVDYVRKKYSDDQALWDKFSKTTRQIIHAWSYQDSQKLYQYIDENEALLEQIGVVPEKVKQFIDRLKKELGGSAKVCGSGSVKGSHAGVLVCFSEQEPIELCKEFGYQIQRVKIDHQGATCKIL